MNARKGSRDKLKISCFVFWHFFVSLRLEEKPPTRCGSVKEGECLLSVPQVTWNTLDITQCIGQANAITPELKLYLNDHLNQIIVEACHRCFRLKMPFFCPGILRSFSFWSTGLFISWHLASEYWTVVGCPDLAGRSFVDEANLRVELMLHTEEVLS